MKKYHPVLPVLFLLLVAPDTTAVQPYTPVHPDPVLEPWRWRSFPELSGLGLKCLAEDQSGNMWFGVNDGVMQYDGVKWTPYTENDGLLGAPVRVLLGARDGGVYAGTAKGISRFDDGTWRSVFPPEGDLPWPIYDLMEAADGSIWAGTTWGTLRLDPERSRVYTTEEVGTALRKLASYVDLTLVPNEVVPAQAWGEGVGIAVALGNWWDGVDNVPNIARVIWSIASGGPGEVAGLKVGDRIVESVPRFLEGAAGSSVALTLRRKGRPEPFEVTLTSEALKGAYRDFRVFDVYEDRDGTMWFGLIPGEIIRCNLSRAELGDPQAWRRYTAAEDGLNMGLRYGQPHIAQTRNGMIWKITNTGRNNVSRFDGKRWTHFSLSDLGGSDVNHSIVETKDGTLWIGGGGLHALRDGEWRIYNSEKIKVPGHRVWLLEASDGALWVAGLGQEAARLDYATTRVACVAGGRHPTTCARCDTRLLRSRRRRRSWSHWIGSLSQEIR